MASTSDLGYFRVIQGGDVANVLLPREDNFITDHEICFRRKPTADKYVVQSKIHISYLLYS